MTAFPVSPSRVRDGAFAICALATLAGCATHAPRISGSATSYDRLGAVEANERVRRSPIEPAFHGTYRNVVVDRIVVTGDVEESVRAETVAAVEGALETQTLAALSRTFLPVERSGEGTLRIRLVVTRITEASPVVNALTTLALGPLRNGALAVEAEALDAADGTQRGLFVWADEGSVFKPRELGGNFRRAGHARQLAERFAEDLAAYLAPLGTAKQPPAQR